MLHSSMVLYILYYSITKKNEANDHYTENFITKK